MFASLGCSGYEIIIARPAAVVQPRGWQRPTPAGAGRPGRSGLAALAPGLHAVGGRNLPVEAAPVGVNLAVGLGRGLGLGLHCFPFRLVCHHHSAPDAPRAAPASNAERERGGLSAPSLRFTLRVLLGSPSDRPDGGGCW